jgi:hypothetical protein
MPYAIARFEERVTLEAAGGLDRVHSVSRFDSRLQLGDLYQNCPILCWLRRDTLKLCGIG